MFAPMSVDESHHIQNELQSERPTIGGTENQWAKQTISEMQRKQKSKGGKDDMFFEFGSTDEYSGLTATRAIQLMSHLPLTIKGLYIKNAGDRFGSEFMDALIQQVDQCKNLEWLGINNTKVGDEKGGQEAGVRLAKVLATNTTITYLRLSNTDLIGSGNVVEWGDALMENTTLTMLSLNGVDEEIKKKIRTKTKDRIPKLKTNE